CRHDAGVPFAQGEMLARTIAGARFVALESRNHVVLEHEPAWPKLAAALREFLQAPVAPFDPAAVPPSFQPAAAPTRAPTAAPPNPESAIAPSAADPSAPSALRPTPLVGRDGECARLDAL